MAMRTAVALLVALGVALPAYGQWGKLRVRGMADSDLTIMREAGASLEGKEVGATSDWTNPETQNSGTATLLGKDSQDGMPCHTIGHRVRIAKTQESTEMSFRSCKTADGRWLLAPKE